MVRPVWVICGVWFMVFCCLWVWLLILACVFGMLFDRWFGGWMSVFGVCITLNYLLIVLFISLFLLVVVVCLFNYVWFWCYGWGYSLLFSVVRLLHWAC